MYASSGPYGVESGPAVTGIEVDVAPRQYDIARVGDRDLKLSERARALIEAGIPESTAKVTARRWAEWLTFCERELRTPLPATRQTLAEFVGHMIDTPTRRGPNVSPRSIEQAIAVVRSVHRDAGFEGQPATVDAIKMLRGYKRRLAGEGVHKRQAAPIDMSVLVRMSEGTPSWTLTGARDRLVLVLGVAMGARRSELCALDVQDVTEVEQGLIVRVRMSKTDQDAEGRTVKIPRGHRASTDAVRLHRAWLTALGEKLDGPPTGRLFRSIDQWDNVGEKLSPRFVTDIIRRAAERAYLDNPEQYTGHSLRAGYATIAAERKVAPGVAARHAGWSPMSPQMNEYQRTAGGWDDNPLIAFGF